MRTPFVGAIVGMVAALALSSVAIAQMAQPKQGTADNSKWKYDGTKRAVGTGGPAPARDFSGAWAGPLSGSGVPTALGADTPSLTSLGQKLMSANKPIGKFSPAGTTDATVRTCDPFGFPRADIDEIRGMEIATMPDRLVVMYQFQQIWREIWTDGRALPTNVGAAQKGAPDPRYYGYSVGQWEGDNTLVVQTTGLDDRTWLNKNGYPHSVDAHIEERFTRTDFNDLKVAITVDDPKLYTKPFLLGTVYFRWHPAQLFDEKLCIPSEVIEYLQTVGDPAGMDPSAVK